MHVDDNVVVVNAGLKSEAVIPAAEFQDARGEITVKVGDRVEAGDVIGEVHSSKTSSEIYTPIGGTVVAINGVKQHGVFLIPVGEVEKDPYGAGWMILIRPDNVRDIDALLSVSAYAAQCKEAH